MPRTQVERFAVDSLHVLSADGVVDRALEPTISSDDLQQLYRTMVLTRELDLRMLKLQQQGRIGTFAGAMGQEAACLGCAYALRPDDWLVPSYRETSALFWRGVKPHHLLTYFMGLEAGNGWPEELHTTPICVTIGSHPLHAVGLAWAAQLRGDDTLAMTFFGDGATSEGDLHEALNLAGVYQAPVVFVCINNQYAISLPREHQTRSRTLAQKAIAYGFPGIVVDGNDLLGCYVAAKEAVDRARCGGGPTFIECLTYRLCPHTTADDPRRYRSDTEVQEWRELDPLVRFQKYLQSKGLWSTESEPQLLEEIHEEIDQALREAEAELAQAGPLEMFDNVYAELTPELQAQKEHAADFIPNEAAAPLQEDR